MIHHKIINSRFGSSDIGLPLSGHLVGHSVLMRLANHNGAAYMLISGRKEQGNQASTHVAGQPVQS